GSDMRLTYGITFVSVFFFSSRRRHTRSKRDWSSDVCSSDLLSKNVLLPINRSGDEEGATFEGNGVVTTPTGFKDAYKQYAESGWVGLSGNSEYGGQGFPKM